MTTEEIVKKAKELGLSEDEISKFIENEAIAKKYGFEDEFSSINVKIDKKKQALIESGASEEEVFSKDDEECCDCDECHCNEHHYHECEDECNCCDDDCCHHHN